VTPTPVVTPAETPTSTPVETVTPPPPTPTPAEDTEPPATDTPTPPEEDTPVPTPVPTPTVTPVPTETPIPTPQPTNTPEPAITPAPTVSPVPSPTPAPVPHTITIYYIYEDGTPAAETFREVHWPDEPYDRLSPLIPSYYYDIPEIIGIMPNRDIEFTVIYRRPREDRVYHTIDEYETPLGLGFIQMHVGVCYE